MINIMEITNAIPKLQEFAENISKAAIEMQKKQDLILRQQTELLSIMKTIKETQNAA